MKSATITSLSSLLLLSLLTSYISASVLNSTDIAYVLDGVKNKTVLTIPVDAMDAIRRLGKGGASAPSQISRTDTVALVTCAENARYNQASLNATGQPRGTPGRIAAASNQVTLHACEAAGEQVDRQGSDDAINALIKNVGALNNNTDAAAKKAAKDSGKKTGKRGFVFWG